ncbi:MAG: glucoamylase family protein [Candidatus Izemoplasmatales bacterium]|jgi:hypothetical protein|nr:glucoamylase family protein [Candidatus Izemoplasmatales bacterium]MDD5602157.1 glucoamylase family protein [Candidatus Izemoplasmatales bacterium]MDY0373118.1 glucoamylase family protein [Candidatus Izemoplasmatales bacterium]NLF48991.1 hypothetical protein [Acholeplasmataceae bacterium]
MKLIEEELKRSFLFFWEAANRKLNSPGYGLVVDNSAKPQMASIASVGFGLSALPIGVERQYITYDQGLQAARETLKTLLRIPHFEGFLIHYVYLDTGKPKSGVEYSTIDTAILLNGVITVDQYFSDPEIHECFQRLYLRVNWSAFVFEKDGRSLFRMAYNPVKGGAYRQKSDSPWIWQWDMMAEQLSLYFLAAGSDQISAETAQALYQGFSRNRGSFGGYDYVYSPGNSLFVYQFSHAWLDFHRFVDATGFDWAENTKIATYGNREWCIQHKDQYPIFSENIWGVTSCLTPAGYRGQGVAPNDSLTHPNGHSDGVVAPCAPAGSLPYAPEIVIPALEQLAAQYPKSFGQYGFTDAIALTEKGLWISPDYIGIDKGITLLMLDNYLHQTTWKLYMAHPMIQKALNKLGFQEKK